MDTRLAQAVAQAQALERVRPASAVVYSIQNTEVLAMKHRLVSTALVAIFICAGSVTRGGQPIEERAGSTPLRIALLNDTGCMDEAHRQALRALGTVVAYDHIVGERETVTSLEGVNIAIANPLRVSFTKAVLERSEALKLLVVTASGYDLVDTVAATQKGIRVANLPDYSTEAVAEHTFALMLATVRHIPTADAAVRRGQILTRMDDEQLLGFNLEGKTLGVVGLGRIGTRVAEIARGFGMRVLAWDRKPKQVDGVTQVSLEQLLSQSDVVTLHLALAPDTRGILNSSRLGLMKRTSVLINTARAELVDERALAAALQQDRLAGAGLDVLTGSEPNPLLTLNNVVLTPHTAYHTRESRTDCAAAATDVVRAFLAGKPKNIIN